MSKMTSADMKFSRAEAALQCCGLHDKMTPATRWLMLYFKVHKDLSSSKPAHGFE